MTRPGHVFHRKLSGDLPVAVSGRGAFIEDRSGRRYLDASGGAVVVNLGQGRSEIAAAVADQLRLGFYFHPTMFTCDSVETLAGFNNYLRSSRTFPRLSAANGQTTDPAYAGFLAKEGVCGQAHRR